MTLDHCRAGTRQHFCTGRRSVSSGRVPSANLAAARNRGGPMMTPKMRPVHLAGSVLERSRHICAFFHSKDEEYDVLLPFIKEGFDDGDRAYHIVESGHRPEHRRRLRDAGIDVAAAE